MRELFNLQDPQRRSYGFRRVPFVTMLILIGCILGSLALVLNTSWTALGRNLSYYQLQPTTVQAAHSTPSPVATIKPSPTPSPTPKAVIPALTPISPFPTNLNQQIQLLRAKDRFLYNGNTALPEIALSFDDGPNPPYTLQILAILRRYGIKATFFCTGSHATAFPALVQQEVAEGHVVGNHTWSHPYLPGLDAASVVWQINSATQAITWATGITPALFRPPYGSYDARVLSDTNTLGLRTILWNVDPRDWSRPGVGTILARVLYQTHDGSIILMHDGGGDRSQTVAALPLIIEQLQRRGFHFVTVQQFINHLHPKASGAPATHPTRPVPRSWMLFYERRQEISFFM